MTTRARQAADWLASLSTRTTIAIRGAMSRRDGQAILALSGLGYLLTYLWAIDHLFVESGVGYEVFFVENPLARATESMGPFLYEPIGRISVEVGTLLVSPVNIAIGLTLGMLVGLNLAVSWVAWRGPTVCRIGPGAGLAASVPALLSGFVCCGPVILLIFGIQASAGIITLFQWMLPLGVVMLILTLLWVGSRVDPTMASASGS